MCGGQSDDDTVVAVRPSLTEFQRSKIKHLDSVRPSQACQADFQNQNVLSFYENSPLIYLNQDVVSLSVVPLTIKICDFR